MKIKSVLIAIASCIGLIGATIAIPLSSSPAGASDAPIKIGYLSELSPPIGSMAPVQGAQGVVNMVNASGGIDGHKLELVTEDTGGSATGALTAAKSLVSQGVFAVMTGSLFTSVIAPYFAAQHMPVIGTAFDGPEWSNPKYSNMFSWVGSDGRYPSVTTWGKFFKEEGVTNLAVLGVGGYPTSYGSAENAAESAKRDGIKVGYKNLNIQLTQVDFTPEVLAMKAAGVNGVFLPLEPTADLQVVESAANNGVKLKVALSSGGGYEYETLDQPTTLADSQGMFFSQLLDPFVNNTPATKTFEADLKKYAGVTSATFPPDVTTGWAWVTAQMLVAGLKEVGPKASQTAYISAMHKLKNFTAGGLIPPVDEATQWGQGGEGFDNGNCLYFLQLKGKSFVPQFGGKAVCGNVIPGTEVLPKNPAPSS